MKCIDEIPKGELKGKRVLVRAGLDLSLDETGEVSDVFRIQKACPTLKYLSDCGARVIILSHIGRDPGATNAAVGRALNKYLKIFYAPDLLGAVAHNAIRAMKEGEIILLENIRQYYDLEKANDDSFARSLASLGEMYVNDAFSNSHRPHASMIGVPKVLPSYAGFIVRDEVVELTEALHPPHPSLAIVGGSKFETKDPVIRSFLEVYDHVCVVGAIANDCLKGVGFPVGRSKISEHAPAKEVCENPRLIVPTDVMAESPDKKALVKKPEDILPDDKIVDIGPDTVATLAPFIAEAKFITWNGPTGIFEEGYISHTSAIAALIAKRVEGGGLHSVIGGGDTIAALKESGIPEEKLGFFSTGGGAMLEFLLKGTLPGIEALQ